MLDAIEFLPSFFFMLKTNQRARAFYYIGLSSFIAIFNNALKVGFRKPRPYWVFQDVKVLDYCSRGFGNPSGHAMWCFAVPIAISLDIRRSNPHGKCMQVAAVIVTLWIGISISWTRLILGVHSLDQVIFGALMGIWIAFTFEFIVRIRLMRHIMRLNKNRTKKILSLTLLFVIASVICLVTLLGEWFLYYFAINRPNHEFNVPPVWE
jgi:membrane-associated phospholipid phosphatase